MYSVNAIKMGKLQEATYRSDKNVLRLKILMNNSLAVDAVQCPSKTTPEVICNM